MSESTTDEVIVRNSARCIACGFEMPEDWNPKNDLTGLVFGRLTVVGPGGKRGKKYLWHCVCECGNECIVYGNDLRADATKSCGCLRIERNKTRPRPRGQASYANIHHWLKIDRGKASDYPCADCGGTAEHWSYDGTDPEEIREENKRRGAMRVYSPDQDRYKPMCRRCHSQFDLSVAQCVKGHPYTEENTYISPKGKKNCRACGREYARNKRMAGSQHD